MPRQSSVGAVWKGAARVLCLSALLSLSPTWAADAVAIREGAPATYTVTEGDTLWDIAGMFLEQPWLWPEVWQINPQIEDPDLIYPGDVIELTFVDGAPVLQLTRGDAPAEVPATTDTTTSTEAPASVASSAGIDASAGIRTVRLSPSVRRERLEGRNPIPAIPLDVISAYLSGNHVLTEDTFEDAPYILGGREGRELLSRGDDALARGAWSDGVGVYDIVRRGRELEDPETGDELGVEGLMVGTATLQRSDDDQAALTITSTEHEVRPGDRLIPRTGIGLDPSYMPTPPPFAVDAAIVSIGTGRSIGGTYDTLIINVGANDRIAVGQLLAVEDQREVFDDQYGKRNPWQRLKHAFGVENSNEVTFPGEAAAQVLIYRVFDDASMGLVLSSNRDVRLNDRVVTPR